MKPTAFLVNWAHTGLIEPEAFYDTREVRLYFWILGKSFMFLPNEEVEGGRKWLRRKCWVMY